MMHLRSDKVATIGGSGSGYAFAKHGAAVNLEAIRQSALDEPVDVINHSGNRAAGALWRGDPAQN